MPFILEAPASETHAEQSRAEWTPGTDNTTPAPVPQITVAKGAPESQLPVGSRSRWRGLAGHSVLAVVALFCVFPVYWLFATSLRRPEDALSQNLIPWPLSLENYTYVLEAIPIVAMLVNTFLMASVMTFFQLLIAVLAAYGFAIWDFPGKRLAMFLFIGSWLVPFQVTMIPNYVLIANLGLLNTIAGVVIPNLASAFGVLMLLQHMRAFPRELIDAAKVDGRNSFLTLWQVVLPNMKPALAALASMMFISAWNDSLWPMLVLRQSDALIQVGIRGFLSAEGNDWGAVMAAAGLACLPVLAIYIFLQRYVVNAFIRSRIK
ncbi:carbohydrate ABC transporter permease [Nesterenkonia sp.]|uniref:carbohydrate ABC transporter permease n=1 Tax=Nesterenkonia sp. TaxID=704201 RepID=UPI00262CE9E8|nr:carbohydrate ABC transporter permease [Nesterenkonia sp.]